MKYLKYFVVFLLTGSLSAFAADTSQQPLSMQQSLDENSIQIIELPQLDNEELRAHSINAQSLSGAAPVLQYAEPVVVSIEADSHWENDVAMSSTQQSLSVWRTIVKSPGALSLDLGFSEYYMPEGGSLFIYSPDGKHRIRAFTSADNDKHGQLWTPTLPGDSAIIEINIPQDKIKFLRLKLTSVNHGYLGSTIDEVQALATDCNVDVACPIADGWHDQVNAVAHYTLQGAFMCSGSALNNTDNNGRGFFLTADHCGVTEANAPSMVVYWNYQNSTCRPPNSPINDGGSDGNRNQFSTGAQFRAGSSETDFTLVELDDPFDPEHNVYLAGWNATPEPITASIGIHHPGLGAKRFNVNEDPLVRTFLGGRDPHPEATYLYISEWETGTTRPGSSGSALFDSNQRVIGQLYGGKAGCGPDSEDWYGAISASWIGDGTNSTQLRSWLDPQGTGELIIDGRDANGSNPSQKPVASFAYSCDGKACSFDGSGSNDSDGHIVSYLWDFGDGNTSTNINPTHTYSDSGSYHVELTVTDNDGLTDSENRTIDVSDGGNPNQGSNKNITLSAKDWFRHTITVPAGTKKLTVTTGAGNGDVDLYLRLGAATTTSQYDCRSWSTSNQESCVIENPTPGVWHVGLNAYKAVSGVEENWILSSTNNGDNKNNGSNQDISLAAKQWFRHTITVPAGATKLTVTTSGGSGDADLYVRHDAAASIRNYDCRSWENANTESCVIENPAAGTWHVGVYGYKAAANVNQKWAFVKP